MTGVTVTDNLGLPDVNARTSTQTSALETARDEFGVYHSDYWEKIPHSSYLPLSVRPWCVPI